MINQVKNINYIYNSKINTIQPSKNPIELYKMMKLYSLERNSRYPIIEAISNSLNAIFTNCKLREIKDEFGNLLAAYTYRFRKNRLDEKSMYIDALVRNRKNIKSKSLMKNIYQDMKDIALNKNAKEMTLFSAASDINLRKNYERLGFKRDEQTWITGGYIMRVKPSKFLSI